MFQPLFLEVQRITENRRSLPYGNQLWVQTDNFGMIKMRLLPERHKPLREAVAELERRYAIHDSSSRAFDSALRYTIQSTMGATPIHSGQLPPRMSSDVLGRINVDVALRNSLASGDVAAVRARFLELVNEARSRTGHMIAVDVPQPSQLIANDMVLGTAAQRTKYRSDAE